MSSIQSQNFVIFEQDYDLLVESTTILQDLRRSEIFCDVVVKAGDQEFPAHRVILAAKIPYFHTMFTSNYKVSKQKEVVIKGVDPSALKALVDFCYSGKIKIDIENVQELIQAADFVQLIKVKTACANFLKTKIQADNVFGIKKLAGLLNCLELLLAAQEFIKENFLGSSKSKEFLQLEFEELMELVQHKDKNCSEEKVFEAVMRWVKYGEAERASHLPEILLKVQFTEISSEYLVQCVSKEKLIRSSLECLRIVDDAKDYHLMRAGNKLTKNNQDSGKFDHIVEIFYTGPHIILFYDIIKNEWRCEVTEKNLSNVQLIGSWGNEFFTLSTYDFKTKLHFYNLITKKWSTKKGEINGKSELGGTTSLNDCVYVCGGIKGSNEFSSSVECYSVKEDSWRYVAPMLTARNNIGVTSLNGYIYAIGGMNEVQETLNSCERYDPTSNTWTYITPMLEKRKDPIIAVLNNKIYACGGCKSKKIIIKSIIKWLPSLGSCEVYDPDTDSWSFMVPMSEFGSNIHLRSFDDKLYAFKSHDGVIKVEFYNPENNSWTQLKSAYLNYNDFCAMFRAQGIINCSNDSFL